MLNQWLIIGGLVLTLLLSGGGRGAGAVQTRIINDGVAGSLNQGEMQSVAISSEGTLRPAYERRALGEAGTEVVWDALRDAAGRVVCATGHSGKLVRLSDGATSQVLAALPEPELTAMTRLGDGSLLIAAAPTGRVYRLGLDDQLTTWAQVSAGYIWRMVTDRDGTVWAATGSAGRLFRLKAEGADVTVQEACALRSANLLDLWIDEKGLMGEPGLLYIAGQDPGWLYRYNPATNQSEVVYNASAEEIRAVQPLEEGLALALNTERSPTPQAMNLTLRMSGGPAPAPADAAAPLTQAFAPAQGASYGAPRSEVAILSPAGFSRSLWLAPERPIHDLARAPVGGLLAAAGDQGRVYEVDLNGQHAIVADVREDYVVRLREDGEHYLLSTARNGFAFQMERRRVSEAVYLSRPLDGGSPVQWGHLFWHGERVQGQALAVAYRTGNDGDPHSALWSAWSPDRELAPGDDEGLALEGRPARFLQYRLTLRQDGSTTPPLKLDEVDIYYIERNAPPRLNQVQASAAPGRGAPGAPPAAAPAPAPASGAPAPATPPPPVVNPAGSRMLHSNSMIYNINWKAFDPNNDPLRYALYYRAADEKGWKLIDERLRNPQFSLDVGGLTDGRYRFRVVASDLPGNPPGAALTAEAVSDEVVVDNTPPVISDAAATVEGNKATLRLTAADATSVLDSVRADLDNGDAFPLLPVDGLMDQRRERFEWPLANLAPGEHVATFSVTDQRGNTSVTKLIFVVNP